MLTFFVLTKINFTNWLLRTFGEAITRKRILAAIAALGVVVSIATPAAAWTLYANHSWGAQIKCGGGSVRGTKQKSNGR